MANNLDSAIEEGVVINGIRWATRNVGASGTFADNPESLGEYYTWEEAKRACPAGWRLPTKEEFKELLDAPHQVLTIGSEEGRIFGTPPNTIFLPAAGFVDYEDGDIIYNLVGTTGDYWSSTQFSETHAYCMCIVNDFGYDGAGSNNTFNSRQGLSVRCVAE